MILPTASSIKKKRNELSMTQSELAKRASVSQPLIARIESGDVDPRLSTIKKIYEAFEEVENESILVKDVMNYPVIHILPTDSVTRAASIMEEYGFSQIPIIVDGISVGSLSEDMLIKSLTEKKNTNISKMKVSELMEGSFPTISLDTEFKVVSSILERSRAVLVMDNGKVVGVITKHDVLKLLHSTE